MDIVGLGDGAAWPMTEHLAGGEILQKAAVGVLLQCCVIHFLVSPGLVEGI